MAAKPACAGWGRPIGHGEQRAIRGATEWSPAYPWNEGAAPDDSAYPLRCFTSAVNCGTTTLRSPTTPRSQKLNIGASLSLFTR